MKDKKKGLLLCVVSILTILLIALDIILFRGGIGHDILALDLFNNFYYSLKKLGISDMSSVFYPVAFVIYIIATFGVRLLGFYSLKDAIKKKTFDPIIIFLAMFAILGFLISEVIYIGPPTREVNKAYFFSIESLMAAWLLFSCFLIRLKDYKKIFLGFVIVSILLSAPTTVQFLTLRYDNNYYSIGPNAIEIVNYLRTTSPQSVVLHHLNHPSLASSFSGRQSVISIFRSFVVDWVGSKEKRDRVDAVASFFTKGSANRSSILNKYKVDYVYAPSEFTIDLDKEPMLIQVLKNRKYVLYKVDRTTNHL